MMREMEENKTGEDHVLIKYNEISSLYKDITKIMSNIQQEIYILDETISDNRISPYTEIHLDNLHELLVSTISTLTS